MFELITNENKEIEFKTYRKQDLSTLPVTPFLSILGSHLKVLSILYNKTVEELRADLVMPSSDEEGVKLSLSQNCLLEESTIELISEVITKVGKAIVDEPDSPDLSVLKKCNIAASDYDKMIGIINQERAFYHDLGLFNEETLSGHHITEISPIIEKLAQFDTKYASLQSVSINDYRPHATFFLLSADLIRIRARNEVPQIKTYDVDKEVAEKLQQLLDNGRESDALSISVTKKTENSHQRLISFETVIQKNQH